MKTILVVLLSCILQLSVMNCNELRFTFTMFRHGARAPSGGVVNNVDILGESWSNPGELTPVGMRMHYLLGHKNRVKYNYYLDQSWNANEMYVKSSDYNRTIMSAQSQLNGLFPPATGNLLSSGQENIAYPPYASSVDTQVYNEASTLKENALPDRMQVFPIHLWDSSNPLYAFFYNPMICVPIPDIFNKNIQRTFIQNWIENFNIQYGTTLRNALGITDSNYFLDYNNLFVFTDTFISGYTDNRSLSKLVNAGIDLAAMNQTAYEFHFNDIFYHYNDDGSDMMFARYSMSPLFGDLLAFMERRISQDKEGDTLYHGYSTPKFVMYSTHDVTLGSAQTFLKYALDYTAPYYDTPFASNLFIELSRTENLTEYNDEDYTVNAIYNDMVLFTMPYTEFRDKVNDKILSPQQIVNWCQFTAFEKTSNVGEIWGYAIDYYNATIVLSCIIFILVGLITTYITWYYCCSRKKVASADEQDMHVQDQA